MAGTERVWESNGGCVEFSACDDGDLCTRDDVCSNGICAGTPVYCPQPDDVCQVAACNPATGLCELRPASDDAACDYGDLPLDTESLRVCVVPADGIPCSQIVDLDLNQQWYGLVEWPPVVHASTFPVAELQAYAQGVAILVQKVGDTGDYAMIDGRGFSEIEVRHEAIGAAFIVRWALHEGHPPTRPDIFGPDGPKLPREPVQILLGTLRPGTELNLYSPFFGLQNAVAMFHDEVVGTGSEWPNDFIMLTIPPDLDPGDYAFDIWSRDQTILVARVRFVVEP